MMDISKAEKIARLKLIRSHRIGNATFWSLMSLYGTAENAIKYIPDLAKRVLPSGYKLCDDNALEAECLKLRNIRGRLVFFEDMLYPPLLRSIENPPPILSFLGNRDAVTRIFGNKLLSVVGSRNASLNNMRFCFSLCHDLSKANIGIVSGLARGIDSAAHKGSLENGTVAFLAGGINNIYPPENIELYRKILEKGGIFSEMPYDTYPTANLFPRRNVLIAGASDGVLVVEAARKSGSLITAKLAESFNRTIFAIPNSPIDSRSQGGNDLIKNGACVVTSANDILIKFQKNQVFCDNKEKVSCDFKITASSVGAIKRAILKLIDTYHITMNDIMHNIEARTDQILQAVIELELAGKIRRIYGNVIVYTGK